VILGLVCAAIASICYGSASVLQATAATSTKTSETMDPRLLGKLLRQWPYLVGLGLDVVAFVAAAVALQLHQPLFVVQAIIAGNVGVTAAIVAFMGTRLRRTEWCGIAALGAGLVLLALAAGPEHNNVLANGWYWVMLAAAAPVGLLGAIGLRLHGSVAAVVLGSSAGLGFAITAVAARSLVIPHPFWQLIYAPAFWAIVAGGGMGMLIFSLALQRVPVTTVTAFVVIAETVVPSAIGLAFLGDTIAAGFVSAACCGLALALAGAAALAKFGEVDLEKSQPHLAADRSPSGS